jgi:hypothetical protein
MAFKYILESDLDLHMPENKRTHVGDSALWEQAELKAIEYAYTMLNGRYDTEAIFEADPVHYNSDLADKIAALTVFKLVKKEAPNALSDGMRDAKTEAENWLKLAGLPKDQPDAIRPRLPDHEDYSPSVIKSNTKYSSTKL